MFLAWLQPAFNFQLPNYPYLSCKINAHYFSYCFLNRELLFITFVTEYLPKRERANFLFGDGKWEFSLPHKIIRYTKQH